MGRALLLGRGRPGPRGNSLCSRVMWQAGRVSEQLGTSTAPSALQSFPRAPCTAGTSHVPCARARGHRVGAVGGKMNVWSLPPELGSIHLFYVTFFSAHTCLLRSNSLFPVSQALDSFCPEPHRWIQSHFLGSSPWGRKLWAAGSRQELSVHNRPANSGASSHLVLPSRLS